MKKVKSVFLSTDCFKDAQVTISYCDETSITLPATIFGKFSLIEQNGKCHIRGFVPKSTRNIKCSDISKEDIKTVVSNIPNLIYEAMKSPNCTKCAN